MSDHPEVPYSRPLHEGASLLHGDARTRSQCRSTRGLTPADADGSPDICEPRGVSPHPYPELGYRGGARVPGSGFRVPGSGSRVPKSSSSSSSSSSLDLTHEVRASMQDVAEVARLQKHAKGAKGGQSPHARKTPSLGARFARPQPPSTSWSIPGAEMWVRMRRKPAGRMALRRGFLGRPPTPYLVNMVRHAQWGMGRRVLYQGPARFGREN